MKFRRFFLMAIALICGWTGSYGSNGRITAQCSASLAMGTAYFVSPSGKDSNPGTFDAPFLSLRHARDVVRTAISSGMSSDVTVYLRGGTYQLTSTLTFGATDSGNNGHNVIYAGCPGEVAIISGGKPITGWSLFDSAKNIYRAHIGASWDFRQLYVNGVHAQRARGPLNPGGFTKTRTGFAITDTSIATWKNPSRIEIVSLGRWKAYRCPVASILGASITIQNPCWNNSHLDKDPTSHIDRLSWLENAYELLDTQGEWYLDTTEGYVYYSPRSSEDLAIAEGAAPVVQDMIVGTDVHNIQFTNLSFEYSSWLEPNTSGLGYSSLQNGYHRLADGSLERMHSPIHFAGSSNILFQNNLFTHLGSRALTFDQGSHNIWILANRFVDNAGGAVQFGQIDDNSNTNTATQNRGITIQDNYIGSGTSFEYLDNAEIVGGYVADMVVTHNEIAGSPSVAISIGWGWGTKSYSDSNQITWNYIHQFSRHFHDSAAVYTLSANPNMSIANNYMIDGGLGYGCLYPDEGSAYESWTDNVCRNVREWLHIWTASVHNNTVTGNWVDTRKIRNKGSNNTILNNTVATDNVWPAGAQRVMVQAGIHSGITPGPITRR